MQRILSGLISCTIAWAAATTQATAGETYLAIGMGLATDEVSASTTGVNHPTRCDSLLYADRASAPTDAACTDSTARQFFGDTFDLGGALSGSISLGYAWDRFRVEAEFLGSSHDGETRPGIPGVENTALQGKQSEWSADSPPFYRVSGFRKRQLLLNVYYDFGNNPVWTPYVGVGAGIARIKTNYVGSYLRRTAADGYVAAVGGDPAQPQEWQLAAAGSQSLLDTEVSDSTFGFQIAAGLERRLAERTSAFLTLRWARFDEISSDNAWTLVRSHAPFQSDGVTPFSTVQAVEDIGGLTATVGIRYGF